MIDRRHLLERAAGALAGLVPRAAGATGMSLVAAIEREVAGA